MYSNKITMKLYKAANYEINFFNLKAREVVVQKKIHWMKYIKDDSRLTNGLNSLEIAFKTTSADTFQVQFLLCLEFFFNVIADKSWLIFWSSSSYICIQWLWIFWTTAFEVTMTNICVGNSLQTIMATF